MPERLLDTRLEYQKGYTGARPVAGQTVELQVTGAGATKVPAGATSVVINVTGVSAPVDGLVTVSPSGTTRPSTSNLNLKVGAISTNLVISKNGTGGKVCLSTAGGTDLIADISGYRRVG